MDLDKTSEKNIIFITIDCLRADHLHCAGYKKNITPELDFLAKNGVLFTQAIANAPYTPYSVPSFLTSNMPPIKKNIRETLAELLKKRGYVTAAFNPNPIVFSTSFGGGMINKGFDTYEMLLSTKKKYILVIEEIRQNLMKRFRMAFNEKSRVHKIIFSLYDKAIKTLPIILSPKQHLHIPSAEDVNKHAINWIKNQKGKFFLWIHYMDVHEPYAPPNYENQKEMLYLITKYRDFPNMLTENEIQKLIDLYDLEIEYTDKAMSDLFKKLKELNCFDNSIIIISADHGDAFGEHGTLGHGGKFRAQVYDEVIRVPLIVYGYKKKGVLIDRQVQLLDVAPTICEMIDIPMSASFFGESLFSSSEKGVIINSYPCIAYRTDKHKLIINKLGDKEDELYDLKADPMEKKNIYDEKKKLKNKMESEMIDLLEKYKKKKKLLDVKGSLVEK